MEYDDQYDKPIVKGNKFNSAVIAATDIFDDDMSPSYAATACATYFRIYAAFDAAGVLTIRRTKAGVTVSEKLNSGANLNADSAYGFDVLMHENETVNLQYSVNATALVLSINEIGGGI